ncbi:4-vinyl reductase [Fodinisporobacter ferrooxydans]|uniref:4-vinyl reductase n=1 Tax=Fodinisporobacter ferrooxydans TaxID=2901836 RepID=A0ABY4CNI0_9BACL|nr:4-vinyl reductase [Alicyclobacillaceae bacterium MYW30-H2]
MSIIGQETFSFKDMTLVKRNKLGDKVPLELFRAIRLIGMYEGLPMHGKATTLTIGRTIGEKIEATSVNELLKKFEQLKIGIPSVIEETGKGFRVAIEDCFCEGLPVHAGNLVCDLEGAIFEGALSKILNKKVSVKEVKCNVNGDERCEYEVRFLG